MRAYICFARNDLADNLLQVIDLKPYSSNFTVYESAPPGQSGYITWLPQNDTVALTAGGGGIQTTNALYRGLAAYLLDNVENVGGPALTLTAAQANAMATGILARVTAGLPLALANINTVINAVAGVALSDLNGAIINSHSTGSVAGILRLLAGEVYRLPAAAQVANAAGAFPVVGPLHTPLGAWVVQGEADFRNFRKVVNTGGLHLSALLGQISHLITTDYTWINPVFTYGAAGTALNINGGHLPVGGAGRAVSVYDATGAVI